MKPTRVTYNGVEFRIVAEDFDGRLKTTQQMIEAVKKTLEHASAHLTLKKRLNIVLRPVECLQRQVVEDREQRVVGGYDQKKTVYIATKREWQKTRRTIFHELGHVEHETKYPGSCAQWTHERREGYANWVADTLTA